MATTPDNPLSLPVLLIGWLLLLSLVAFCVTVYDKWAATHRPRHRTPEHTLLTIAALGGSGAMLLTMCVIRHKTRHAKFMVGLPLLLVAQVALAAAVWWLTRYCI